MDKNINGAIEYMIRVLEQGLERHIQEYAAEGKDAPADIIISFNYQWSMQTMQAWINELKKHRHCFGNEG